MSSSSFLLGVQDIRDVNTIHYIPVRLFTSIKDIKDILHQILQTPASRMKLYHASSSNPLSRMNMTLHDLGIEQEGHVLRLAQGTTSGPQFSLTTVEEIQMDAVCKDMVLQVRAGLQIGQSPIKTLEVDCSGGVYFMKAPTGQQVAVFKPSDEEQGMPNNPKGHAGNGEHGLRPFFKPGYGYLRETAAYLLDFQNFCQVPPTTIVHCEYHTFHYPKDAKGLLTKYPKLGSLQKFVRAGDTFEDISPSLISTFELQKIALLDIRILNCDRNVSNILAIRKPIPGTSHHHATRQRRNSRSSSLGSYASTEDGNELMEFDLSDDDNVSHESRHSDSFELIPIDHGYCIPTKLRIEELDWAWYFCRQIEAPIDPEIIRYVNSIDIESLLSTVNDQVALPDDSLFLLRLTHYLLVEGMREGLTLKDIATIIVRLEEDVMSPLEKVIDAAEDNAFRAMEAHSSHSRFTNLSLTVPSRSPTPSLDCAKLFNQTGPLLKTSASKDLALSPTRASSAEHRSPMKPKVVASELNLESIAGHRISPSSARKLRAPYLSSENIERLQRGEELAGLPMKIFLDQPTPPTAPVVVVEPAPESDSYFLDDLQQSDDRDDQFDVDAPLFPMRGVSTGINDSLAMRYAGEPLSAIRSLDPSMLVPGDHSRTDTFPPSSLLRSQGRQQGPPTLRSMSNDISPRSGVTSINTFGQSDSGYSRDSFELTSAENSSYEYGSPTSFADSYCAKSSHYRPLASCNDTATSITPPPLMNPPISLSPAVLDNTKSPKTDSEHSMELVTNVVPFSIAGETECFRESLMAASTRKVAATHALTASNGSDDGGTDNDADHEEDVSLVSKSSMPPLFGQPINFGQQAHQQVMSANIQFADLSAPPTMTRAVSFGAFGSAPLFSPDKSDRQMSKLHLEKRRDMARTAEYQELRLKFARAAVHSIVVKFRQGHHPHY